MINYNLATIARAHLKKANSGSMTYAELMQSVEVALEEQAEELNLFLYGNRDQISSSASFVDNIEQTKANISEVSTTSLPPCNT